MNRSLQLKVWILLAYVLLCTALVLLEQDELASTPYGMDDSVPRAPAASSQ